MGWKVHLGLMALDNRFQKGSPTEVEAVKNYIALSAALSVGASCIAQSVVTWGYPMESAPPRVSKIIGVGERAAGILPGGYAACWGSSSYVPLDLGQVLKLSINQQQTLALKPDGTVVCWTTGGTFCATPPGLEGVRDIASTADGHLALRNDGTITYWGGAFYGDLGPLAGSESIEGGETNFAGIRSDGSLRIAGGIGGNGSTPTPPGVFNVKDVALGQSTAVIARTDGAVITWGTIPEYGYPQPTDLGPADAVAASGLHVIVLQVDGRVRRWGYNCGFNLPLPPNLPLAAEVAAGYCFEAARLDTDCDQNGVRDSLELADHDCNGNDMHDSCEAQVGALEDCNGNGLGDTCEKQLTVDLASGHLGPIGVNQPRTWSIPSAVMAAAPVTLRIRGHGDFSGQLESVTVTMGTMTVGTALAGTNDCGITPWREFTVADFALNSAIDKQGQLTFGFETSIAVDPLLCPDGTWIEAELKYTGAAPSDCNANGLLDSCEIAAGLAFDGNGNGIIDICESALSSCPADFDQNGEVNAADLAQLLNAWGPAPGLPGLDLNPDGVINGADLSILLNAWGSCAH
jgi:hypothetical protein